jgi:hypothetical protein
VSKKTGVLSSVYNPFQTDLTEARNMKQKTSSPIIKRIFGVLFLPIILALFLFSCTQTSAPFQTLVSNTKQHISDSSSGSFINSGKLQKEGKTCSWSMPIVNIFFYGAGEGVSGAIEDAGITKIASIDHKSINILDFGGVNFYNMECIIVTGE